MYRVADYIFEYLANAGVGHAFLVPGGGAMHLVDALGQSPITYVATHHEQAASISAEAYSRVPGKLGCALVTTGPGVTNAITGVAGAWIDSVPMVVISGQVKRADLMGETGVRQMGPQEVDVESLVSGITKYCVTVMDASEIRYHLERALHEATSARPGPVWLDIPLDIQATEIDPTTLKGFDVLPAAPFGLDSVVADLQALIAEAKKPLIFAGHGVRLSGAADEFRELIDRLQIPVVATWNAMDLIPWDDPMFVGRPGSVALRAPNFAVQNADLLICLGTRLDNVVTAFNPRGFGKSARKILIDIDPAEIAKLGDAVDVGVAADLGEFIPRWLAAATPAPTDTSAWKTQCEHWKQTYQVTDFGQNEQISHYNFVSALSDAVPADTLISTGSSGLAVEVFYEVFRVKKGQRVFLTSGLGAMGYGLPAAIGACLANDSKPMVAVESDGSLQLNLQEFNTWKGLNLPMHLFVMNNGGYASIRTTQRNYFEGRYVGTGPEARLFLPDLEKLAAVYDFPFVRIDSAADMPQQLAAVMAQPGPVICEVMLAENEALQPKVAAIVQEDGSMTSMPLEDMTPLLSLDEMREVMGENLSEASLSAKRDT